MGDVVSSLSHFLKHLLRSDCHMVFHFPAGYGYETLMPSVMALWKDVPYKLTFEVDTTWASIQKPAGFIKFGAAGFEQQTTSDIVPLWMFRDLRQELYWPATVQWKGNKDGPIAILPNHEYYGALHPIMDKFFTEKDNDFLLSLIDNKKYINVGKGRSFEENVEILSECRYVVGLEGGWTHVSNAMRVPYIIVANKRGVVAPLKVHHRHPHLTIVHTVDMYNYLTL